MINARAQRGFSILEVLISFVILIIGILGASILIIRSSQVNVKAYETEQVAIVANTFVEKVRLNAANIDGYINPTSNSGTTSPCSGWSQWCDGEQLADLDIADFVAQLNSLNIRNIAWDISLVNGSILGSSRNQRFQLLITWDSVQGPESSSGGTPSSATTSYYSYFITDSGEVQP